MAWDAIQFLANDGHPVRPEEREVILQSVDNALLRSDRDVNVILKAAAAVGRRVDNVRNDLHAYAGRTLWRAVKRDEVTEKKRNERMTSKTLGQIPDPHTTADRVEMRVLVRELLESLAPQDREIVLRHMAGQKFARIDEEMSLKPRTAEFRFRSCKNALRAQLDQRARP